MKVTFKGYDPELGKKFAQDSSGLVIGRARSSPPKSEAQSIEEFSEEHGYAPDEQQLHDWIQTFKEAPSVTQSKLPGRRRISH